jgi:MoaA/NifB/PqqE/SkfB family radical SAM enzyme
MNIYQIETSAFCNAECSYCPHHLMTREQGNMTYKTYVYVLRAMKNNYFALHHFGEPTFNPNLPTFIRIAALSNKRVEFSTNGYSINRNQILTQAVYAHPYLIRLATDALETENIVNAVSVLCESEGVKFEHHSVNKGTKPFINFAGAIEGESQVKGECYFKKYNYVCVLWNGDVVPCCCDYNGEEILGNVFEPEKVILKENYSLCKKCDGLQFAEGGLWTNDLP